MNLCNRAFISYRSNRDVFGLTPWTWHRHPVTKTASGDKARCNHKEKKLLKSSAVFYV